MSLQEKKIAFVGSGNMASSIITGLVKKNFNPKQILVTGRNKYQLNTLRDKLNIEISLNNIDALKADVVVLCLKPFQLQSVCHELAQKIQPKTLFLSVAAGVPISAYSEWLGAEIPVVRTMPNTPSAIGLGVAGLYANSFVSEVQKNCAVELMTSVGQVFWLDDDSQFDVVTALSGSGPAYLFLFMEELQRAAQNAGLGDEQAEQMTKYMVNGAAQLALQSSENAAQLRKQVTSPGGTTEHAVKTFQQGGLGELVEAALMAAVRRSKEISEDLKEV